MIRNRTIELLTKVFMLLKKIGMLNLLCVTCDHKMCSDAIRLSATNIYTRKSSIWLLNEWFNQHINLPQNYLLIRNTHFFVLVFFSIVYRLTEIYSSCNRHKYKRHHHKTTLLCVSYNEEKKKITSQIGKSMIWLSLLRWMAKLTVPVNWRSSLKILLILFVFVSF